MNSVLYLKKLNAFNSYFDRKVISNDFSSASKTVQSFKSHLKMDDALIETYLESIVGCLNNYILFSVYHYMSLNNICDFDAKSTLKDNITLLTDFIDPNRNKELHLKYVHAITSRLLEVVLDPSIWCVCSKELLKIFLKLIRPYESVKPCRILEKNIILYELVDKLFACGEYNYQTILLQVIIKLMDQDQIKHQVTIFFPEREDYQRLFQAINSYNYELHVRTFLNRVNASNGKVVSIAAEEAWLDTFQLKPVKDFKETSPLFWVDFNTLEYNKTISFQSASPGANEKITSNCNSIICETFVICIQHLQQVLLTMTRKDQANMTSNENKVIITLRLGKALQCEYGCVPKYANIKKVIFKMDNSPNTHTIISTVFPEIFGNKLKDEAKMFLAVLPKTKLQNTSEVVSEALYKIAAPTNYKSLNLKSPGSRNNSLCQSWLSAPGTSGNKKSDLRSVNSIITSELPLPETLLQPQSRLCNNDERDRNSENSRHNQKQCYIGYLPNLVKRPIRNLFEPKNCRSICSSLGSLGSIEEEPEVFNISPVKQPIIFKQMQISNATFAKKALTQKPIVPAAIKNSFLLKPCTNSLSENNANNSNVRNSKSYKQSTSRGQYLNSVLNKENPFNRKRYLSAKIYNPKRTIKGNTTTFESASKVNTRDLNNKSNNDTNTVSDGCKAKHSQRKMCKITTKSMGLKAYKLSKELNENIADCNKKDVNITLSRQVQNVEDNDEGVTSGGLKQKHLLFIGFENMNTVKKSQLVENVTKADNCVHFVSENKMMQEISLCIEQSEYVEYKENENPINDTFVNSNKDFTKFNFDEIRNDVLNDERIANDQKDVPETDRQLLNIETDAITFKKLVISNLEIPPEVNCKKSKKHVRTKKNIFKRRLDNMNCDLQTVNDNIKPIAFALNDAVVSQCNNSLHYSQDVQDNVNYLLYNNANMVEQESNMNNIASITGIPIVQTASKVIMLDRLSSPKAKSTPMTMKRSSLREAVLNYTNAMKHSTQYDNQSVNRKSDCESIKSSRSRKLFDPNHWSYSKHQISTASSVCTAPSLNDQGDRTVNVSSPKPSQSQNEMNVIKENLPQAKDSNDRCQSTANNRTNRRKNVPILFNKRKTAKAKAKRFKNASNLVIMGEISHINNAFDSIINEVVLNRYEISSKLGMRKHAGNMSASRDKRKKLTNCFIPLNELRNCVNETGFCIFSCDGTEISDKIRNCNNSESSTDAVTIRTMEYIAELSKTLKQNIDTLSTLVAESPEEICLSESYLSIHKYCHTNKFNQSKSILS